MASSFYNNTLHVDFDSVLAMDNPGMVSVFNALMASGLEGFLGCPAVLYEAALVDFFNNGSVRDGLVVSSVNGVPVEITEQLLAETFELPVDGLSELSEIPRDKVFDAKSIVSLTGEPVSTSGKKSQLKIEYRLLCDIMAKTISVKAGSFNAITMEKFLMLTAVVYEVRFCLAPADSVCSAFISVCTVLFEYSLFSRFSLEDITSFVAFIASERTNLRSIQITTPSAVSLRVPILLDQRSSSTSSSDESMHFDDQDTATAFSLPAATLPSLPAVTTELSTSLDDLRIFLSERFDNQAEATRKIDDAQSDVLSRLHTIKRDILAALMKQEEALRNLINTASQDGRTLDDAQTLRFNEFRKVVLAQSVSATADMLEFRKEIKTLDAKVTSLDEQVAATRNDSLEFHAQALQTLNIVTDQLSELVAYINRGGNDKKGEVSSSRPPPDDQNRGSGNTGGGGDTDRTIFERLITVVRERGRNRSGSYKRRRY
ncbi:hypothetical protein F511_42077 [Dorcoceras hygrometricum]|uniref:Dystroglycan-like n=1 Tax=Dorcoceras hygrometricum TaxID=472368 RepID=A0A2Z7D5N5_9LAMI|nr:hypothetical protein F511_42077 [Dorcoceras hygrometricum]